MISTLNQMAFHRFGSVLTERSEASREHPRNCNTHRLEEGDAQVFRASSEIWLTFGSGSSVLSVGLEPDSFFHFYLDKPVCLQEGVYFALSAFQGPATVLMEAAAAPRPEQTRIRCDVRMERQLLVDCFYTFFYQEREQGFLFPGEAHPMAELTYVDQGELHSVVDGQDLLLRQGDLMFYGPNQWHMQYSDIGVAPRFVTISFDLRLGTLEKLLNRRFTATQAVADLLQSILREQERMDELSQDVILSELNLILLLLLREADGPSNPRLQTCSSVHSENEIVRRAQQYISQHIQERLSVPIVARQVDVSASYLTALFHKNLQISPGEYIRRIKLQESKQMIREGNLNFTQIASQLQYSTVHHFSRQFKEKFGITPTEYAKSVR